MSAPPKATRSWNMKWTTRQLFMPQSSFRGNSQELHVVGQELLVYGKEQSEAAGEYQTETHEDQQRTAIANQRRDQALIVVAVWLCDLLDSGPYCTSN